MSRAAHLRSLLQRRNAPTTLAFLSSHTGTVRGLGLTADMTTGGPEHRNVNPRGILPGYQGFVPGARDKYGGTTYGGGPLTYEDKSWPTDSNGQVKGYFLASPDGVSRLKDGSTIVEK
eukprot:1153605-Prymnesium_polylepis.2